MRRHDSSSAFRHVRVSQIDIMLCGHYNRKYEAGTHPHVMLCRSCSVRCVSTCQPPIFQKRIIIYYYYEYARNDNSAGTCFTLPGTRSSPDRSLNTYAFHLSSASSSVNLFSFLDKIMELFFRDCQCNFKFTAL